MKNQHNKGMADSVVAATTAAAILIIGIWVVMSIVGVTELDIDTLANANNSITFTSNNTYYNFANTPITLLNGLYYNPSKTTLIPSARYAYDENQIKIYANSTVSGGHNVTAGDTYYADYKYKTASTVEANTTFNKVQNITWSALKLLAVGLIVMAAGVILAYFGVGRR